jgi:hypothetical protein
MHKKNRAEKQCGAEPLRRQPTGAIDVAIADAVNGVRRPDLGCLLDDLLYLTTWEAVMALLFGTERSQ